MMVLDIIKISFICIKKYFIKRRTKYYRVYIKRYEGCKFFFCGLLLEIRKEYHKLCENKTNCLHFYKKKS